MTREQTRQRALAKWIGEEIDDCPLLVPFDRHSGFHVPSMPLSENWLDARMCDAAWWSIAAILGHIDHAWRFGWHDGPREPWGFVTEPYLDDGEAEAAVQKATLLTTGWGVGFLVLPKARSSWNPGACVPIVAHCERWMMIPMVRNALAWAFR